MSVTVAEISPSNWAILLDGEVKADGFPDQAAAWREVDRLERRPSGVRSLRAFRTPARYDV